MENDNNQTQENRAFKKEDAYENTGYHKYMDRKYGYQGFICISISRSFNRCYI